MTEEDLTKDVEEHILKCNCAPTFRKNVAALMESDKHLSVKIYKALSIVMEQNERITHLANKFDELEKQRQAEFLNKTLGSTA